MSKNWLEFEGQMPDYCWESCYTEELFDSSRSCSSHRTPHRFGRFDGWDIRSEVYEEEEVWQ